MTHAVHVSLQAVVMDVDVPVSFQTYQASAVVDEDDVTVTQFAQVWSPPRPDEYPMVATA